MPLILIVDDVRAMAEQYAYDLKRLGGYDTLVATTGAEALDVLGRDSVDCVILDLEMPGMDGFEVLRQMEQRGHRAPVIVYVYPSGARAASAGAPTTLAADFAVMAPGTNLGAAHPVAIAPGGGEKDETMTAKVVNDAVAYARSIAERVQLDDPKLTAPQIEGAATALRHALDWQDDADLAALLASTRLAQAARVTLVGEPGAPYTRAWLIQDDAGRKLAAKHRFYIFTGAEPDPVTVETDAGPLHVYGFAYEPARSKDPLASFRRAPGDGCHVARWLVRRAEPRSRRSRSMPTTSRPEPSRSTSTTSSPSSSLR